MPPFSVDSLEFILEKFSSVLQFIEGSSVYNNVNNVKSISLEMVEMLLKCDYQHMHDCCNG